MANRRADTVLSSKDRAFLDAADYYDDDYSAPPAAPVLRSPGGPPRRSGGGLVGPKLRPNQIPPLDSDCRSKTRTRPHEKYCDLYYHVSGCEGEGQSLLRSCPNGLLYTGGGRHGLIGVCDYPHNVDCTGREKHSEFGE